MTTEAEPHAPAAGVDVLEAFYTTRAMRHLTSFATARFAPRYFATAGLQVNLTALDLSSALVACALILAVGAVAEGGQGAPGRFTDPARVSLAHGGKDGHPFPVPLRVYDRTISVLKEAIAQARLGRDEKLQAIRRLDEQARRLEDAAAVRRLVRGRLAPAGP